MIKSRVLKFGGIRPENTRVVPEKPRGVGHLYPPPPTLARIKSIRHCSWRSRRHEHGCGRNTVGCGRAGRSIVVVQGVWCDPRYLISRLFPTDERSQHGGQTVASLSGGGQVAASGSGGRRTSDSGSRDGSAAAATGHKRAKSVRPGLTFGRRALVPDSSRPPHAVHGYRSPGRRSDSNTARRLPLGRSRAWLHVHVARAGVELISGVTEDQSGQQTGDIGQKTITIPSRLLVKYEFPPMSGYAWHRLTH